MALAYLFDPNIQNQTLGGVNNVGGFLRVYIDGTDDRATTYKDFSGTLNKADIELDANGRAVVVVDATRTYRMEVYSRDGFFMWSVTNLTARGRGGGSGDSVVVDGTPDEIDVTPNQVGGVMHYVASLAAGIKSALSTLGETVNTLASSLRNKKDKQQPVTELGSTTKVPVSINQDANGEIEIEFDDISFPDWTSAINDAVSVCEKTSNKKNTLTGYESSTTAYPSIKAVVDFVNAAMQNLGGKLITDNGAPFASSSALPTTTPYHGVDIADKDYAYIQNPGTAERWSATVTGSSVTWVQEYAISIPVFTPTQQAAIDSGVTAGMLDTFLTKTGDGSNVTATFTAASSRTNISSGEKLSVIFGKIAKWFSDLKAVAFSGSYTDLSDKPTIPAAANNGVLTIKQNGTSVGTFSANQSSNTEINVTDTTYESKPEASGGTAVSLVTTGEKYTWNHKQNALPTTGTPSSTFAINVSGTAYTLPYGIASWNGPNIKGDKKVISINPTNGNYNDVMVTLDIYESVTSVTDMFRGKLMIDLRRNADPSYGYYVSYVGKPLRYTTLYVKYDTNSHILYVIFNKNNERYVGVKAVVVSAQDWQGYDFMSHVTMFDNQSVEDTSQYTNLSITFNYICSVQAQVGSTRLPIFANADGSLSPMNIDEYYCWAQPTTQWTDVMEMTVWYVQNQCNNEILGSTRNINLNATHPSLCYLHVKLPELQGAGRYRFTLEFEITNSSGQNETAAYGVLILDPPTGYSGESFLAECVYDSNGKAQSSVMNQIHIPPQGSTYRHKLYVDGHTYRVVKTK